MSHKDYISYIHIKVLVRAMVHVDVGILTLSNTEKALRENGARQHRGEEQALKKAITQVK